MAGKKDETKATTEEKNEKKYEEVIAKKEEKLKEEAKKPKTELEKRKAERQKQRELLKNINENMGILMFCNLGNKEFTYECPNSHQNFKMRYGDTDWFTYKEIKTMKSQYPRILEDYALIPIDLDNDEYDLQDILKILGLGKLYEDESKLFEENIDYILNNLKFDTFCLVLKDENKTYVKRIIDRAKELAIKGLFNDYQKMSYIEEVCGDKEHEMFKTAIENYKQFGI